MVVVVVVVVVGGEWVCDEVTCASLCEGWDGVC